jgi:hypothetical protein
MTPVSEAVEREEAHLLDLADALAEITRLTEHVRMAMEAMLDADRRLSRPDWTVQRDTVRTKLRETITRMEKNDD